ncbi:hypothetical protein LTR85_001622 [Meristemomyces frigidus]|nr:hypothetical protein LTR85_001622 [Meristemomyces frigidus]
MMHEKDDDLSAKEVEGSHTLISPLATKANEEQGRPLLTGDSKPKPKKASIPQSLSVLLALPGELRNRIFHLAVVPDDEVIVDITCLRKDDKKTYWRIKPGRPVLAFTCKALKQEVTSIYFAETTFSLRPRSSDQPRFEAERVKVWSGYLGSDMKYLQHLRFDVEHRINARMGKTELFSIYANRRELGSATFSRVIEKRSISYDQAGRTWRVGALADSKQFCACDVASAWAADAQGDKDDGARLLEVGMRCALDNGGIALDTGSCVACGMPQVTVTPQAQS